ncbi:MAG: hypothetical protein WCF57_17565 [Pyrinomonadaceae bacterium]
MDWIARLEAETYSAEDAVPKSVLKEWYDHNPQGFFIIKRKGHRIGHVDVLPLRPATLETFCEGKILERDIPGTGLYTPAERDSIRDLYVESVIIQTPQGSPNIRAPAISYLLSNFTELVGAVCDPGKVESVYAIAASRAGERLMLHLGFRKVKPASERTDGHDFFAAEFAHLAARLSRFSRKRFAADERLGMSEAG